MKKIKIVAIEMRLQYHKTRRLQERFDQTESAARSVTFERAMATANEYEAEIIRDGDSLTPHFVYYVQGPETRSLV